MVCWCFILKLRIKKENISYKSHNRVCLVPLYAFLSAASPLCWKFYVFLSKIGYLPLKKPSLEKPVLNTWTLPALGHWWLIRLWKVSNITLWEKLNTPPCPPILQNSWTWRAGTSTLRSSFNNTVPLSFLSTPNPLSLPSLHLVTHENMICLRGDRAIPALNAEGLSFNPQLYFWMEHRNIPV